jgi:glycosyltransferase involved in cell wall biosynthesis
MKISVALCTFNGARYVEQQIDSLIQQTRVPDEIIVSDDGSNDATLELIRNRLTTSGIPYQIFRQTSNLGVFKNFDFAFQHCTGDLIFPCDQDDVWLTEKIQRHLEEHEDNPDLCLVYSNAWVVSHDLQQIFADLWPRSSIRSGRYHNFKNLVVRGRSIAGCCMSFKRSFYQSIGPNPDGVFHDDWIATTACLAQNIKGIDDPLMKYRQHDTNVVGIQRGHRLSYIKSLFVNVRFYVDADAYIYNRHQKMFEALKQHPTLKTFVASSTLDEILALFKARQGYQTTPVAQAIKTLTQNLRSGSYRHLAGIFTYLKDVYNVLFMRLFYPRNAL